MNSLFFHYYCLHGSFSQLERDWKMSNQQNTINKYCLNDHQSDAIFLHLYRFFVVAKLTNKFNDKIMVISLFFIIIRKTSARNPYENISMDWCLFNVNINNCIYRVVTRACDYLSIQWTFFQIIDSQWTFIFRNWIKKLINFVSCFPNI